MATTSYYMLPLSVLVQYFTNVGLIAAGATVTIYQAGSVSSLATTYTDSTGLVANANPMTLASNARPTNPVSAAQVAFWVASGVAVDVYFQDTLGETWSIKNMAGINDPAATGSLQTQLAAPANTNASGIGPVGGVDLVANAMKAYDVIADLRAANQPVLESGQVLTAQVQGGAAINDGLGGDFYWNATSTAVDNGTTIVKPAATTGAGRWLRLGTPPLGGASVLASGATTDLGTAASNFVQITGTQTITSFGSSANASRPLFFLTFTGAASIQQSANMTTPGGSPIQCAAGDFAVVEYISGSSWQFLAYIPAVGLQQVVVKSAPQTVSASTTLVADTALTLALPAGTYLIQARLQLVGTTATSNGFKINIAWSGSASNLQGSGVVVANGTAAAIAPLISSTYSNAANSDTSGDVFNADFEAVFSTSGVLTVEFAQATAQNTTTMQAGSALIIKRVA